MKFGDITTDPFKPSFLGTKTVITLQKLNSWEACKSRITSADYLEPYKFYHRRLKMDSHKEEFEDFNAFWNQSIDHSDDDQFEDYWQTPTQTLKRLIGDCDDNAIAKKYALRGIPSRLVTATHVDGPPHMLLAIKPRIGWLFLNNNPDGEIYAEQALAKVYFPRHSMTTRTVWAHKPMEIAA